MARKASPPANPRNSVLYSQDVVHFAEAELRQVLHRVQELTARLDRARADHRAQIARSLTSKDAGEREMASNIATWWEVPLPEKK